MCPRHCCCLSAGQEHAAACHNAGIAGVSCESPCPVLPASRAADPDPIAAPTVGLGIGRFAYSLVLPDMRDSLAWSYSAAGFMNTINAAGYLVGALFASRLIQRFGLARVGALVDAGLRAVAGAVRRLGQFRAC